MFLTFTHSILRSAIDLAGLGSSVLRSAALRSAAARCRPATGPVGLIDQAPPHGIRVDRIDDPDGAARIVRIVGALSPASLPKVMDAWSDARSPHLVHIDLADAVITDLATMTAFERAIDHLERQRIDIRIVGLDPSHPTLAA